MSGFPIKFNAVILRKQPDLPRYLIVKPEHVPNITASFAATVSLNGKPGFKRNIHPWGKGANAFFFNLTAPQCKKVGVDTGDLVDVEIWVDP